MSSRYPDEDDQGWRSDDEAAGSGLPAFLLEPRGVFERRWRWILAAMVLGFTATGVAVAMWSPRFRAESNILITSQQIPEAFVRSTVREDSIANINAMVGRVLSETNLIRLLDAHDLYGGAESKAPLITKLANLRASIEIGPVSKSRSRSKETALVYGIAFEYTEPEMAAVVANGLASYFVEASMARRQAHAQKATHFLQSELVRDEAALSTQARKVTEFRQENRGTLPDELDTNLRKLEMLTSEKEGLTSQIAQRQNRIVELASGGHTAEKSENEKLLDDLRRALVGQVSSHTDEHPNVVALRRRIANQERVVRDEQDATTGSGSELGSLRRAEQGDIRLMRERLNAVDEKLLDLNSRIEVTPRVAEGLMALEQEELVLREDYVDTLRKVKEAELAESLESAQQGGQVAVLDRARPPDAPAQPMWFTLIFGIVATFGLAIGIAALLELVDPVIVSMAQLNRVAGREGLGSFPEIA